MVAQYPHYLFEVRGGESVQDEHGDWIPSSSTDCFVSKCREETDGRGTEFRAADGMYHRSTSLIQLPKGVKRIANGVLVFVADNVDGSNVRIRGVVLNAEQGQLHSRLWL